MYAIVRRNSFDPGKVADARASLLEFDRVHAAQSGFIASIVIDEPDGRRLAINLWESERHATAALTTIRPEVGRLLTPLMVRPSELIGVGPVVGTDQLPRRPAPAPTHVRSARGVQ